METPSSSRYDQGPAYNLRSKGKGKGYHLRSSDSKLKKLKPSKKVGKRKDPHDESMIELANLALHKFNSEMKSNFKLVKIGSTGGGLMRIGFVRHLDFTAKELDDPHARPKTFFTEVITTAVHHINVCQCLGPTASLPKYADNHGCAMCCPGLVHHPSDGNFLGKLPSWYTSSRS